MPREPGKIKLPVKFITKPGDSKISVSGNIMLIREPLKDTCSFFQVDKKWNKEKKTFDINLGYTKTTVFIEKFIKIHNMYEYRYLKNRYA